jgi:hypothetical protein
MKYIIVSELVGTPGEEFVPPEGTNVEALIEGGFITTKKSTTEKSEE